MMWALNSDPQVLRYTGDAPFTDLSDAERIVAFVQAQYREYGMGRWVVERRDNGEVLGWCGLKRLPETMEVDLGYRFFRRHWGQGYATEAGAACLQYGFDSLGLERIVGRVMPDNTASVRVLEKLGMRRVGLEMEGNDGFIVYECFPYP